VAKFALRKVDTGFARARVSDGEPVSYGEARKALDEKRKERVKGDPVVHAIIEVLP
jgi:hypothetical protein